MAGFAGVPEDDRIIPDYLTEAVHRLDIADYIDNPYLKTIRFPDAATRHWRFTHYTYKPYEAFICNDIRIEPDLREIPQAGYFRERFRYPAVEQDGRRKSRNLRPGARLLRVHGIIEAGRGICRHRGTGRRSH